jgi:hypothetical protein
MRKVFWLAGLLLGPCLCGTAAAQVTTTATGSGSFVVTRVPTTTQAGTFRTTTPIESGFRLSNLFSTISNLFNNPRPIGHSTTIPDPSSPDYLKAFGFQKISR